MEYTATIHGIDYVFDISYGLAYIDDLRGGVVWGVDWWSVTKIDGKPNLLGDFWSEMLNDEFVRDAILYEVSN